MAVVLSLARYKNRRMAEMFRAFAEYAENGEAVGFGGVVRWSDGSEQMVLAGPYQESAQAIKAVAKMKHHLLDDTKF